jgi:tRNA-dihydrouridine synthase A
MEQYDGVMLGRAAWHNPGILSEISRVCEPQVALLEPAQVVHAMVRYAANEIKKGVPLRIIVRPMLGWMSGRAGARFWRRTLSDQKVLNSNDANVIEQAWADLTMRSD